MIILFLTRKIPKETTVDSLLLGLWKLILALSRLEAAALGVLVALPEEGFLGGGLGYENP